MERFWEGFGRLWEGVGKAVEGFGRLWKALGDFWARFLRFGRERRRKEERRTPIYKTSNSRSSAPWRPMLVVVVVVVAVHRDHRGTEVHSSNNSGSSLREVAEAIARYTDSDHDIWAHVPSCVLMCSLCPHVFSSFRIAP